MTATPGTGRFRLTAAPKKPSHYKLPRGSHMKSRNGCQTCKGGRVKCDEHRPTCGRCSARGFSCVYINDIDQTHMLIVGSPVGRDLFDRFILPQCTSTPFFDARTSCTVCSTSPALSNIKHLASKGLLVAYSGRSPTSQRAAGTP
ncbi:hypothetical protein BJX96DRAFT_155144 [Aspergillus floccosus]